MLTKRARNNIYRNFCSDISLESLQENFNLKKNIDKINNREAYSAVAYIDIYNFSSKIMNFTPIEVKDYLYKYYSYILSYVQRYNGEIDKIMGDGIIVVFSKIFAEINTDEAASDNCFRCCKECIENLCNTDFEVKAAIGTGKLFFCKTGVEQIYEEYTCIGHPLTIAYRLENIAEKNQILLMANTPLSSYVNNSMNSYLMHWEQYEANVALKGIKQKKVHIVQY